MAKKKKLTTKKPAAKTSPKKAEPPFVPNPPALPESRYCSLLIQLGANRRNLADLLKPPPDKTTVLPWEPLTRKLQQAHQMIVEIELGVAQAAVDDFPNIRLPIAEATWLANLPQ